MPLQQGDEAFTKRMLTSDAFQRNGVLMLRIYLCMLQSQILQVLSTRSELPSGKCSDLLLHVGCCPAQQLVCCGSCSIG